MLNYIKAEIYRTRKSSNNIIMWGLGIFAILIVGISTKFFSSDPSRNSIYFSISQLMLSMSVFISILIMGASFKKDFEEKNYVEKGFNRSNIIIGDLIVASISTIIKALGLTLASYLLSLFFKEGKESVQQLTGLGLSLKNFIISVGFTTLAVMIMNCGVYAIYNISGKSGIASTLSFFLYLLMPQISMSFMGYDNIFGKICKLIFELSPLQNLNLLLNKVIYNENSLDIKYLVGMLVLNLIIFNLISIICKERKRY